MIAHLVSTCRVEHLTFLWTALPVVGFEGGLPLLEHAKSVQCGFCLAPNTGFGRAPLPPPNAPGHPILFLPLFVSLKNRIGAGRGEAPPLFSSQAGDPFFGFAPKQLRIYSQRTSPLRHESIQGLASPGEYMLIS